MLRIASRRAYGSLSSALARAFATDSSSSSAASSSPDTSSPTTASSASSSAPTPTTPSPDVSTASESTEGDLDVLKSLEPKIIEDDPATDINKYWHDDTQETSFEDPFEAVDTLSSGTKVVPIPTVDPKKRDKRTRFISLVDPQILADANPETTRYFDLRNASQPEINNVNMHSVMDMVGKNNVDTGSASVQVAVFSMRLRALDRHIASNHKDESAKYRRQALHIKRYRLLLYLKRKDIRSYVNMLDMFDIPPVRSRNRMMRPSGVA